MPMPRSLGSSQVTLRSLMKICPSVGSSRPAMQFSNVDFPQPDEPSSTRNSPSWMSRLRFLRTLTAPKESDRSRMETLLFMDGLPLHCACGDAADEQPARDEIDDEGNGARQQRRSHVDIVFLHALNGVDDVVELHGHRISIRASENDAEEEVVPDAG